MAKQKTTEATTLAVVGNVESAPQMLGLLKKELGKLTKVSETPFKVSGSITVGGRSVDISTETNITNLIMLMGSVETAENAYTKAAEGKLAKSLNGTYPLFKISGHTVEAIAHDINLKIEVISYSERKKELEELVKEGEKFLTEKDQFNMYLAKVAAKFGGNQEQA